MLLLRNLRTVVGIMLLMYSNLLAGIFIYFLAYLGEPVVS